MLSPHTPAIPSVNSIPMLSLHIPAIPFANSTPTLSPQLPRPPLNNPTILTIPISHPLFHVAEVQNFNDDQIEQFLKNWYHAVLRLSQIPQHEQEELNLLIETLKENPRLHKLAENPLLLTVITALHRYERLPDRRVLVYDRCADLLLETWARLRGTHDRWKDMKMIKDDQYACVAYLAFVLHERSQDELNSPNGKESETVDVTSRFICSSVETFIKKQKLITAVSEQRSEAKRFISLIQEEAGLIVERGTDENGEPLYGFVHRTFQEYFAAAHIYEQYMQKTDLKVISKFLTANLHDPHWREVILLLLGKLKSTPVTNQLRQILQGKIKSHRSHYTEIMQQDLFFVCDCLLEEIKVENTLVDLVVSHLNEVIRSTWSPAQRKVALEYLGKLARTQQYTGQGVKELVLLVKDEQLDTATRLEVAQVLYLYSVPFSKDRDMAESLLTALLNYSDLLIDQAQERVELLYQYKSAGSEVNHLRVSMLMMLVKREDLSVEQVRQSAESLYKSSSEGSKARQLGISLLQELVKREDLSVEQRWQSAVTLYQNSLEESEANELGASLLRELAKRGNLSVKQVQRNVVTFYQASPKGSEGRRLATLILLEQLSLTDKPQSDVYLLLKEMVPQFHELPIRASTQSNP